MEANTKKVESPAPLLSPKTADNLEGLDIPDTMVEDLVLRRLYTTGTSSIKALSQTLKLSYTVVQDIFNRLRKERYFEVKGMEGRDYRFTLSEKGHEMY